MPLATLNWDKTRYQRGVAGYFEYFVDGVANEAEATATVPYQLNSTHPFDSRLIAEEPAVVEVPGPRVWFVGVNFKRPSTSTSGGGGPSPFDTGTRIRWSFGVEGVSTEYDAEGRPILNTAGDPPSSQLSDDVSYAIIEYSRVENFFDPSVALGYINRVNDQAFSVPIGHGQYRSVGPYQALCRGIGPEDEFTLDDEAGNTQEFIRTRYVFEFRDYAEAQSGGNPESLCPFHHRFVDQGLRGWFASEGENGTVNIPGDITHGSQNLSVPRDVLLDGKGKPYNVDLTVEGETPIDNPNGVPSGCVVLDGNSGKILVYKKKKYANFNSLGL